MVFLSSFTPGWPQLTHARPLIHQCITLWSGVLSTQFGGHRAFKGIWPLVDPRWPLHDLWPQQWVTLWQGFSFYQIWWPYDISKQFDPWLTPADPCMTFNHSNALCSDLWSINALHSGLWFFLPNLVATGHLNEFDLWLTPDDPCMTFDHSSELHFDRGSSYQIWWPYDISKQFDPWLTPADPCMTFNHSNALCSGKGFFPPNLVATGHC